MSRIIIWYVLYVCMFIEIAFQQLEVNMTQCWWLKVSAPKEAQIYSSTIYPFCAWVPSISIIWVWWAGLEDMNYNDVDINHHQIHNPDERTNDFPLAQAWTSLETEKWGADARVASAKLQRRRRSSLPAQQSQARLEPRPSAAPKAPLLPQLRGPSTEGTSTTSRFGNADTQGCEPATSGRPGRGCEPAASGRPGRGAHPAAHRPGHSLAPDAPPPQHRQRREEALAVTVVISTRRACKDHQSDVAPQCCVTCAADVPLSSRKQNRGPVGAASSAASRCTSTATSGKSVARMTFKASSGRLLKTTRGSCAGSMPS